ncbi:MAG: NADH-quinone oxidoreductase subunit NuoE [Salinarimonas sp.]|nr:NADH-quinone oxidoreductase subunit NuoE [Salinarimonas sp.]
MAVRRLAPEAVQPKEFSFTPQTEAWTKELVAKYPQGRQASAVIPLLWRVQSDCGGWLPQKAIEAVSERLEMPYIRVYEVATFYTMFNLEPVGKFYVQMCGTTPCMLRGSNEIRKVLEERVGPQQSVSEDGMFSWLEVECLGACCNAPMVQINDDYYEDLTPENFNKLLDDLAAGKKVNIGSQAGRKSSEPEGDVKTLTDPALYDGSVVGSWRKRFEEEAAQRAAEEKAKAEQEKADKGKGDAGKGETKAKSEAKSETKAEAEVRKVDKEAAVAPKKGHPDAGRATERPVAEAPAQQKAAGEEPLDLEAEDKEIAEKLAALHKDASPEDKANAVGSRPKALKKPRKDKPDDLKKINGIGPANADKLHNLGIYHYDQIAQWGRPEIRWVGQFLSFAGRIDREDWVGQAKTLAASDDKS